MTEDKATYQAMSTRPYGSNDRLAEIEQWPPLESDVSDLLQEVRRLKQRQRELCVLMGWLRGRITWDAAGRALGFNPDTASFRQYGRLEMMVDAAIDEGKRIIEEAEKAASGGD